MDALSAEIGMLSSSGLGESLNFVNQGLDCQERVQ